jgi:hypothetical protein
VKGLYVLINWFHCWVSMCCHLTILSLYFFRRVPLQQTSNEGNTCGLRSQVHFHKEKMSDLFIHAFTSALILCSTLTHR